VCVCVCLCVCVCVCVYVCVCVCVLWSFCQIRRETSPGVAQVGAIHDVNPGVRGAGDGPVIAVLVKFEGEK